MSSHFPPLGCSLQPVPKNIDIIAPAENLKKLFLASHDDSPLALTIHRIGGSLVWAAHTPFSISASLWEWSDKPPTHFNHHNVGFANDVIFVLSFRLSMGMFSRLQ